MLSFVRQIAFVFKKLTRSVKERQNKLASRVSRYYVGKKNPE